MNPYLSFVQEIQQGLRQARDLQVEAVVHPPPQDGPVALLFSPHPDDECITGLLPLRLAREAGFHIVNVPVTFGSNRDRQAERARELEAACAYLGWESLRGGGDLESLEVDAAAELLTDHQPAFVFMPHARDWNSRHISTHHLVVKALQRLGPAFACTVVETEFWGAMDDPNLMVEADTAIVADLVAATSLHAGEVARNPYHLLLPAWMQDNVRRGGELVGGQGASAPGYTFATLYRVRAWRDGGFESVQDRGVFVDAVAEALREVYPWK